MNRIDEYERLLRNEDEIVGDPAYVKLKSDIDKAIKTTKTPNQKV
jgi:hypothetical protein